MEDLTSNLVLKVAAKALVINSQGQVLLVREASTYQEGTNTGRYQCPGGRLNPGESYNTGLAREVKEETGLDVEPLFPVHVGEWRPVIKNIPHQIIAIFTVCRATSENIFLSEEHDEYIWIDPLAISELTLTAADKTALEHYAKHAYRAAFIATQQEVAL